ncbi:acetoacetate decarboxylase family protein [Aeromicrobium wangtongii]|uniref:acetoacetate decarboxylase family protein n=1 Tax=Aeromicrobium wangtongii TaxID=2969247 RepID=UPI002016D737|nr:acetoacetate decarboxylase family protein [Aeromicrobium wangtongii]MCL3819069.1 acetoacetate decarboxylase family protein [Aeromicrobium wangtongii]
MTGYPAEPWDLHGHAYIGAWLVPRSALPAPHSPATKPLTIFGRGIVGTAFFVYEEPSPLTYDEIMATVLVRQGWRIRVSITHIWVNSPDSRDGGRALWAIPKELADFDVLPHAAYTARGIGSLSLHRVRRLPWMLPAGFRIAQDRDGSVLVSPVAGRVRPGIASARWTFAADGPLGFLRGRKPLMTVAARPFRLMFGSR